MTPRYPKLGNWWETGLARPTALSATAAHEGLLVEACA